MYRNSDDDDDDDDYGTMTMIMTMIMMTNQEVDKATKQIPSEKRFGLLDVKSVG